MPRTPLFTVLQRWSMPKFWARVERTDAPDECWDFPGTKTPFGYGVVQITREYKRIRYSILAHRLAWVLHNHQEVPEGKIICHRCDNPACCNPKHLYAGTPRSNTRDAVRRKRFVYTKPWQGKTGERHPCSRYSDEQRARVIELRRAGKAYHAIWRETGVPRAAAGRYWKEYVAQIAVSSV